ncbi:MAG: AAR2 pre-mRNA splicing protein [Anaerolineae bacterium]|nr:AAR2 pre-mRNA splicing protein [Anaerolineae bacterium]
MFGAIVLRDVPKEEARIDWIRYQVQGGFRGFGMVPAGLHYVSVKHTEGHVGFWCWLKPQQVIVKIFDEAGFFEDADAETQEQYADLALSGAIGAALISYPLANFAEWFGSVMHIAEDDFPPVIHTQDPGEGSRFDRAFLVTHGGNSATFLAEFQYAFAHWVISGDTASEDVAAFERWKHLVLSAYNAGERITQFSGVFSALVDVLLRQFAVLGDEWFAPDSFLVSDQASWMAEDMQDSGVADLPEKGQKFLAYLERRKR